MYSMVDSTTLMDTLTGLVIFMIGGKEFCADIKDVTAIINPNDLREPLDLKGEISSVNINRLTIPVLNLHSFFNVPLQGMDEEKRILAVEPVDIIFGFVVDRVKEIFAINMENRSKLDFEPLKADPFLLGIINYEGRSLYLPDYSMISRKINEENHSGAS